MAWHPSAARAWRLPPAGSARPSQPFVALPLGPPPRVGGRPVRASRSGRRAYRGRGHRGETPAEGAAARHGRPGRSSPAGPAPQALESGQYSAIVGPVHKVRPDIPVDLLPVRRHHDEGRPGDLAVRVPEIVRFDHPVPVGIGENREGQYEFLHHRGLDRGRVNDRSCAPSSSRLGSSSRSTSVGVVWPQKTTGLGRAKSRCRLREPP
jgi:hypothetical protein